MRPIVEFIRVHPNAVVPHYATSKAAGFDLCTCEDVSLMPGEIRLVTTGLVIQTPPDHMLYITFRSSTPRRYGVTVLEGIVDEDYCGPDDVLHLQLQNLAPQNNFSFWTMDVPAGTRLAQGIFIPVTHGHFLEIENTSGESRGGFGSTG